jgi:hypothetical protein
MNTKTALVEPLKGSRELRVFFKGCCETSAFWLRAQALQFRAELAERGQVASLEAVEDSLLELARHLFPGSPAADFVTWAGLLCGDAIARLGERFADLSLEEKSAIDLSAAWEHNDQVNAACEAAGLPALRKALRSYEREALNALVRIREESGAA